MKNRVKFAIVTLLSMTLLSCGDDTTGRQMFGGIASYTGNNLSHANQDIDQSKETELVALDKSGIELNPEKLIFKPSSENGAVPPLEIEIRKKGKFSRSPRFILDLKIEGENSETFSILNNSCEGKKLEEGLSCKVMISSQKCPDEQTATLSIRTNDPIETNLAVPLICPGTDTSADKDIEIDEGLKEPSYPEPTSISPQKISIGSILTLKGADFGDRKGKVRLFNGRKRGKRCKVLAWTDKQISCKIRKRTKLTVGEYEVAVKANGAAWKVVTEVTGVPPSIDSAKLPALKLGKLISIKGDWFGTKRGKATLMYQAGGKKSLHTNRCSIVKWTMKEILCRIPKRRKKIRQAKEASLTVRNKLGQDIITKIPIK